MSLAAPTTADVADVVTKTAAQLLKLPDVSTEDNLLELGVDSLVGTRIVVELHSRFDVEVPLILLFEHPVVSDFVDVVLDVCAESRG
jgi:acyl carrier protein